MNFALSRRNRAKEVVDVPPDAIGTIATRAQRYAMAHELAHVRCEHYLQRWVLMSSAIVFTVATVPALRLRGWSLKAATTMSMWLVVPGFFGTRYISRTQEREADLLACQAGYANGGWRERGNGKLADDPIANKRASKRSETQTVEENG